MRPKPTKPKAVRDKRRDLDRAEAVETADWVHDKKRREQKAKKRK